MAKDRKPWESPFDPANWGKLPPRQEEQARAEREARESEKRILGPGCGNPMCPQCYPEKNRMGNPFGGGGGGSEEQRRRLMEEMRRIQEQMGRGGNSPFDLRPGAMNIVRVGFDPGFDPPPKPSGPPESYVEARKAVEQFILKADPTAFDDIKGNEEALSTLIDAIQAPVKYKELYKAYGMKMPKGALLSGPPGCGKTMFARAAATEFTKLYGTSVEFISIQSTDIQSMFIGATEAHIRNIFSFAREYMAYKKHPLLVFMDEAEIMFPDRTGRNRRVAPWEESQVATFLAEMDGIRESCVFMLLATNRPEQLDSALLRDGRCDFKIVVKRPTKEVAESILHKAFTPTLAGDDKDSLVFAALESFYDGNHIIAEASSIVANFQRQEVKMGLSRHFLLEDIVSGAMLVSIPMRATRYAFARDKAEGTARGVTVPDVLRAVTDIFEENKRLEHPFAIQEFMEKFTADVTEELKKDE